MKRAQRYVFWPAVALLLALMGAAEVASALRESQTWDEAIHLSAGYSYWRTGDFRMNPEHPPLLKLLAALPLLALDPHLPTEDPSWTNAQEVDFGRLFLYHNRVPADTMLLAGRSASIVLSLCLGLAIALWTRIRFGAAAALLATLLYAADSNFIAHGHYITTDVAAALFYFLTAIAWQAWLEKPGTRRLVLTGVCLGLALASKFSTVLLLPLLPLMALAHRWEARKSGPAAGQAARAFAAALLLAALIVAAVYGPRALAQPRKLKDVVDRSTPTGYALKVMGRYLGLPAHPYLAGLDLVARHNKTGHPTYLLGNISEKGSWLYFPVAFAVKTPTGALLLLALAAVAALLRRGRCPASGPLLPLGLLLLPPLFFFAASMTSTINLGVRHILPVYPFLYVLAAAALFRFLPLRRAALVACLAAGGQVAEAAAAHPHYLAYFNWPSGGSAHGAAYLLDSNLDWGQELKSLKRYLDARRIRKICFCYFGGAEVSYYKIEEEPIPTTRETEARGRLDCIGAISATPLHDLYVYPGAYRWLREKKPMDVIGHSIYLYDLRRTR